MNNKQMSYERTNKIILQQVIILYLKKINELINIHIFYANIRVTLKIYNNKVPNKNRFR